ncbi:MAG TPA: HepT-like ribonuclease domain-containing protein [Thermomicrobiales bacterium]|nr:HepT-like ribonuclease domain-containing protein [Thermomicrobiales bacterium]
MTTGTRRLLLDVLRSCQMIRRYTVGVAFAADERDDLVRDAVERRLAIIGEALNKAAGRDPAIVQAIPELRQIVGARNRLIHNYDAIDDQIVWEIVQDKLPLLEAGIEALLDREPASD